MRIKPWLFLLNVIIHIIFLFLLFFLRKPSATRRRRRPEKSVLLCIVLAEGKSEESRRPGLQHFQVYIRKE